MRNLLIVVFFILAWACKRPSQKTRVAERNIVVVRTMIYETIGHTPPEEESRKFFKLFSEEFGKRRLQQAEVPLTSLTLVLDKEAAVFCCLIRILAKRPEKEKLFELFKVHIKPGETDEKDAVSLSAVIKKILKDPNAKWRSHPRPELSTGPSALFYPTFGSFSNLGGLWIS
jgi:hypothetical protein